MHRSTLGIPFAIALAGAFVAACSSSSSSTSDTDDGGRAPTDTPMDAGSDARTTAPGNDASVPDASDGGQPDAGGLLTYRSSLSRCWTEPTCQRALSIAHGGDWSFTGDPYDSDAALAAAYAHDADGVKIDARITKDGIAVVAHSSPIEKFESLDCAGKKIEEMTAAQVTQCHRVPSSSQTFQRLDSVLGDLRGKLVVQVCVKVPTTDLAGVAATVLSAHAEDFAFLEISTSDLQTLVPSITDNAKLWYVINIEDRVSEVDTLLDTIKNPRAFLFEFDPNVSIATLVTTRLHPAGIRSFTYDESQTLTVAAIKAHFDQGADVVSTNLNSKSVQARVQVNTARGITPP